MSKRKLQYVSPDNGPELTRNWTTHIDSVVCALCDKPADRIGVFEPFRRQRGEQSAGKVRIAIYGICESCSPDHLTDRTLVLRAVEAKLLEEMPATDQ